MPGAGRQHLAAGEYADIDEGEFLAYAITQHMQAVSNDEHLWVRFHKESTAGAPRIAAAE